MAWCTMPCRAAPCAFSLGYIVFCCLEHCCTVTLSTWWRQAHMQKVQLLLPSCRVCWTAGIADTRPGGSRGYIYREWPSTSPSNACLPADCPVKGGKGNACLVDLLLAVRKLSDARQRAAEHLSISVGHTVVECTAKSLGPCICLPTPGHAVCACSIVLKFMKSCRQVQANEHERHGDAHKQHRSTTPVWALHL